MKKLLMFLIVPFLCFACSSNTEETITETITETSVTRAFVNNSTMTVSALDIPSKISVRIPLSLFVYNCKVDDFAVRKNGIYLDKDTASAKEATFNKNITVKQSNVYIIVDNPTAEKDTIYTYEVWLWPNVTPFENRYICGTDSTNDTIPNDNYIIARNVYQGNQSNGTVPYVKISLHIKKK